MMSGYTLLMRKDLPENDQIVKSFIKNNAKVGRIVEGTKVLKNLNIHNTIFF